MTRHPGSRLPWIVTVVLAATLAGILPAAERTRPLRILWAGSSSTYYHDLPMQVADRLTRNAGIPAEAILVGRSGDGIHWYLRPGYNRYEYGIKKGQTFLEKIKEEKYDLVVLQAVTTFITGTEGEDHAKALDLYCQTLQAMGVRPVLYEMGWDAGALNTEGRKRIAEIARRQRALLVPCSTAWQTVRKKRPELELQNLPDRAHPGTLGGYLNLCCFYTAFTGKAPQGLPAEFRVWRPARTEEEKQVAARRFTETKITDPYLLALPGWMQRKSVGARLEVIEPETAQYMQHVAWKSWEESRRSLAPPGK